MSDMIELTPTEFAALLASVSPPVGTVGTAPSLPQPNWSKVVSQAAIEEAATAADIRMFVDDLCGEPASWSVPLPVPGSFSWWPNQTLSRGRVTGTDLLLAGAQFQARATPDHPLRAALVDAAARLVRTGRDRLGEAVLDAKHEAKHERRLKISLAKHE